MERKDYQDLVHMTEAERSALAERMRIQSRNAKGPKGERRRDRRWEFSQAEIAVCVEHPGGGISKFLVCSRDLSAGGMAFFHGGFLHVGSRCKIVLGTLDGKRNVVSGTVTSCNLVEGRLHSIGIKFEQRIDPGTFLRDYVAMEPEPVQPAPHAQNAKGDKPIEPVFSSLNGIDGASEQVNAYIANANAAAKRLADAMQANDLAMARQACESVKGPAAGCGFEKVATLAAEVMTLLDSKKSIADATAQLQELRQLCERVTAHPKENKDK